MGPRLDRRGLRIGGTVLGLAFLAIGTASVYGAMTLDGLDAPDRVFWYGVTTVIAGVLSIVFAWLEPRPEWVFCAPPRRPGHRLAGPSPRDTEQAPLFEPPGDANRQASRRPRM